MDSEANRANRSEAAAYPEFIMHSLPSSTDPHNPLFIDSHFTRYLPSNLSPRRFMFGSIQAEGVKGPKYGSGVGGVPLFIEEQISPRGQNVNIIVGGRISKQTNTHHQILTCKKRSDSQLTPRKRVLSGPPSRTHCRCGPFAPDHLAGHVETFGNKQ